MKKQKFGLLSIVLLGINSIIGTGIFLMPGKAFALVGSASLLVYLFVALLAGSIALCFAEAAGLFSTNGGAYIYTKEAFGNFFGFEVGVMKFIVQVIAWATMAVGFVTALGAIVPAVNEGVWYYTLVVGIIAGLTVVNLLGIDLIKYINNTATIGKIAPLILFIAVGIFFIQPDNFTPFFPENLTDESISAAVILVFYGFTGFEALATAAEDMEDPTKNIPRALLLSVSSVVVIYILIQFVCIGVLGAPLGESKTPVVDAIGVFMGDAGRILVTAGTLVSIGGINVAASFHTPRQLVALSEQHMLPLAVTKTNKRNVPYVAILLTGLFALPIALSGSFVYLATISTISRFAQYIPTVLSVLKFRKEGRTSTFVIPFGYVVPIFALAATAWLFYHVDVAKIQAGLGALVLIIPLYFVMKWYNKKYGYSMDETPAVAE